MAKRALRLVKHLGRTPAVAACTVCGKRFEAPLTALLSVKDAEASLQQSVFALLLQGVDLADQHEYELEIDLAVSMSNGGS